MPRSPTLLWFRQDLRLQDNPALAAALVRGAPIVPLYIWDEAGEGRWPPGAAARGWLQRALASLDAALRERNSRLLVRRGRAGEILQECLDVTKAGAVYWNRRYEPAIVARDQVIKAALVARGIEATSFNSALLHEPAAILNKAGRPFQVFTPYWRTCLDQAVSPPTRLPAGLLPAPARWPRGLELKALGLSPRVRGDGGLAETFLPGEAGAAQRWTEFGRTLDRYDTDRNRPDRDGTSMLSPWLHTGEIGPRQLWAAIKARSRASGVFPPSNGARVFLAELGWREFAHHLLFHFPHTPEQPLRDAFARFPWAEDPGGKKLRAWQQGRTGYPIVDAGMRQLWRTGWMHNRVRMIVASFLVKHLRLPWNEGAAWFWETLVDADLANNTLGWQWTAGCGADASPYFRVFAPVRQGMKFDPDGAYVRRWMPELAALPTAFLHAPWEASATTLESARVKLGRSYPHPIVDHVAARAAALAAFQQLRA